ncbi:50S ribosomal protein L11 methyltransferase [Paenibacillus sp. MMS20-IR301]|uniref:50S ribosomal protein L11 methyltransferase n=1 Tax=Paenibacillus sp. MMS20-IR301 TaxID=2895946 RepID=UPI0028E31DF9|nr:50S ribosomal protein L11 methyltransferase [Paenibacillus sp. MMS20-IR301]WNS43746.1 50S ribosomal protein L11 methyltransferase [Paenibacillus sp. MMS20-IR301]
MLWHELTVHTTEEAQEMISNLLYEAGAGGVSIEESGTLNKIRDTRYGELYDEPLNDIPEGEAVIKGYYAEAVLMDEIVAELTPRVEELREFGIDPGKALISWKTVDEDEWAHAWKQYFKPLRVSERLTIKPTWEDYTPESAEEKIIEIDPGMAFGTGTHPTTALCLRALEQHVRSGDEVIDVGTGSGILAVGAVLLGAKSVLALDLDPVAVESARENVALNRLEQAITVKESDLLSLLGGESAADTAAGEMWPAARPGHTLQQQAERDAAPADSSLGVTLPVRIVVANILAEIIVLFTDDVYRALQPEGLYITSGIYKDKEGLVAEALKASGFEIIEITREEDWVAFTAGKR